MGSEINVNILQPLSWLISVKSYLGSSELTSSVEFRRNSGTPNLSVSRLSSSVKDLSLSYLQNDDYYDDDDTSATLNPGSTVNSYRYSQRTSISTIRNNFPLTTDPYSYTFSTVDLPTIKQFGISIQKPSSTNQCIIENPPRNELEVITKSGDSFDKQSLPDDLWTLIDLFNDNDQGVFIEVCLLIDFLLFSSCSSSPNQLILVVIRKRMINWWAKSVSILTWSDRSECWIPLDRHRFLIHISLLIRSPLQLPGVITIDPSFSGYPGAVRSCCMRTC